MHRQSHAAGEDAEEENWSMQEDADSSNSGSNHQHDAKPVDELRRLQLQEASRRSRKRQKREFMLCTSQIEAVQQQISELTQKLDAYAAQSSDNAQARQSATESVEMKRRIAFLKDKMDAHRKWKNDLRNLLASAPLLDLALRLHDRDNDNDNDNSDDCERDDPRASASTSSSREEKSESELVGDPAAADYATLDEWRKEVAGKTFSPLLIAKHVHAAVTTSQANATKLLDEFAHPACAFAVHFTTRGWSIGANADGKLLTFRASRVIPNVSASTIAAGLWHTLQKEDILRTFMPVVQDSVFVYESESAFRSANERIVHVDTTGSSAKTVVTIESIQQHANNAVRVWQIVVESCDDPCLMAFASDSKVLENALGGAAAAGSPPANPTHSFFTGVDLVLAARCCQDGWNGVRVQFAGSIRYSDNELVQTKARVELVQYLVCMLPIYEDLHLVAKA